MHATVLSPDRLASVADSENPDAVVLDLRDLPTSAFSLLHTEFGERGTVVICALMAEQLERIGADLDIDDFVVLPVMPMELSRRVERALWRRHGAGGENQVRVGPLEIDLSNYKVSVGGEAIVMTFKEYELLRFLAMNAGHVFTREQLLNRVWGYDYFGGARTVDVHIRRIRSKIEIQGQTFIETVRNVGYRLVAPPPRRLTPPLP